MNRLTTSLVVVALSSVAAQAAEVKVTDVEAVYATSVKVEAKEALEQRINFGFANTTGNAKTTNVNGKYELSYTTKGYANNPLKVDFDAGAFMTKNNGVKDNEEYTADLGLEQYLTNSWLGYSGIEWTRNKFQNYDNRFEIGLGIGKELFNDGHQMLKCKLGAGYNIEEFTNGQATKKFGSLNQYVEYSNQLNKVSKLILKMGAKESLEDFSEDYEFTTVAGFDFIVAERISVTIEEELRYDHLPPVGFKKTDTKSIVRVGYSF